MDKKRASETGIRVELLDGTHSGVAVDALVDDWLHGNSKGILRDLHEPYSEDPKGDPVEPEGETAAP